MVFTLSLAALVISLQTHNVAMASPLADYVVSLGMDGRVASHGSVSDAIASSPELVENIPDEEKKIDQEGPDATAKQTDGKLIVAEEIAEGHVSWDACNCHLPSGYTPETHPVCKVQLFFKALGGSHVFLFWIFFVSGLLLSEAFIAGQTWFMGHWAEQYVLYPPDSVDVSLYVNTPVFPQLTSHFFVATFRLMDSSYLLEQSLTLPVALYTFLAQ